MKRVATLEAPRQLEDYLKEYSSLIIQRNRYPKDSDEYDELDGDAFYLYLSILEDGFKYQFEAATSSRDFWRKAWRREWLRANPFNFRKHLESQP